MVDAFASVVMRIADRLAHALKPSAAALGFIFMLSLTAVVAISSWFFPINNWDMLAYLASAHEASDVSVEVLHHHAYETMRENVSEGEFLVLTQDRPYRIHQYEDPAAFFSMLGFYRVKMFYVEAIDWLSHWVGPYDAIRLLSVVPAMLIGLVLTWWLAREGALHLAPLAVSLLLVAGFGACARMGTPDVLSGLFFIGGMFAFLRRSEALAAVLLFLAFLVRPDHIAYLGVLMVVALFVRTFSWGATAAFVAALVAYVPLTSMSGHPGWWVQFWFTNVEYVPTLEGFDPAFSLTVYLTAFVRVVVRSLVEEAWLAVAIIATVAFWQIVRAGITVSRRETTIVVATLLAMAAKMMVFPLHETRFHMAYIIVLGMVVIGALRDVAFLPQRADRPSS